MIHPDTELRFIRAEIGFGVVATKPIPRGSITWVQDPLDQVFPPDGLDALGPLYAEILRKYTYPNLDGSHVLCWDLGRYVNHSCAPSCLGGGYNFELAVRDIGAGEELTDDYASLNLTDSFECRCGAAGCRGVVREADALDCADAWDRLVGAAFPMIAGTPQPLWPLVKEKQQVQDAIAGKRPVLSCRRNLRAFLGRPQSRAARATL